MTSFADFQNLPISWSVDAICDVPHDPDCKRVTFKSSIHRSFKEKSRVDAISLIYCIDDNETRYRSINVEKDFLMVHGHDALHKLVLNTEKTKHTTSGAEIIVQPFLIDSESTFEFYLDLKGATLRYMTIYALYNNTPAIVDSKKEAMGNLQCLTAQRNKMTDQLVQLTEKIKKQDGLIQAAIDQVQKSCALEKDNAQAKLDKIEQVLAAWEKEKIIVGIIQTDGRLKQTTFSTLVSGESISIARKNQLDND